MRIIIIINIRVFRNSINKGPGYSRNVGVENAVGSYIWFVDSDDYIEKNCLNRFLYYCESGLPDIFTFNRFIQSSSGEFVGEHKNTLNMDHPMSVQSYVEDVLEWDFFSKDYNFCVVSAWYRREFLNQKSVRFPELYFREDSFFASLALINATTILAVQDIAYYNIFNANSLTKNSKTKRGATSFYTSFVLGEMYLTISKDAGRVFGQKGERAFVDAAICSFNSFIKPLMKGKIDAPDFFEKAKTNLLAVEKAKPYLSEAGLFLINHPRLVQSLPQYALLLWFKILAPSKLIVRY